MSKQIIIDEQNQVAAVFGKDQIQELIVSTGAQQVSDVYLGTVDNVIPGIDAAFVNIGDSEKNGFIHVSDLGPLRLKKHSEAITELLSPQQKVLVQVMKEPTGNKGPRLTGNISLPGRYVVLIPYGKGVNLSRRISSEAERARLRALAILIKPAGMAMLVRTEAEGTSEEAIIEDLEFLQRQWETIQEEANNQKPPCLLNRDDDFIQRVLRDVFTDEVNRIVVDTEHGVKRVKQHLSNWSDNPSIGNVYIDHHQDPTPILDYFRVNAGIREALKPKAELPSGGYIIIEPTEALTVVDVNSGSFTKSSSARETVLWTNYEAATEIARQLKLRNIGGVIIVDFIDMDHRKDKLKLLEHFNNCLKSDKARPQIAQLTELGLVELTRKRQGKNIYELFGEPCSHCGGLGHLALLPGDEEPSIVEQPKLSLAPIGPSPSNFKPKVTNFADDASSLELLHHPSYEQQNSNNRRRRRRNGDSPSPSLPKIGQSAPPKASISTKTLDFKPSEKDKSGDKPARSKKEVIPVQKEKVVIQLSEVEQDIYSAMGVSPLIKLDREFPNLKNVELKVNPIGVEEPEELNENKTETISRTETLSREELLPTPIPDPEPETTTEVEVAPSPVESNLPKLVLKSEVEAEPELKPEETTRKVSARRKRRSSAATTTTKSDPVTMETPTDNQETQEKVVIDPEPTAPPIVGAYPEEEPTPPAAPDSDLPEPMMEHQEEDELNSRVSARRRRRRSSASLS